MFKHKSQIKMAHKKVFSLSLALIGLITATMGQAQAAGIVWRTSVPNSLTEAKRSRKPVFVDFTAVWCGPCQEMKRKVFTDKRVISELRRWVSVSVDTDKQPKVAMKYKVEAMPTLIAMKPSGAVATKSLGYKTADELLAWLKANYAKAKK